MNKNVKDRIKRENRRRTFTKQAKKRKKKWFSYALKRTIKGKFRHTPIWQERVLGRICSFCLWFGLGVLMVLISGLLFWRTGKASVSDYRFIEKSGEEKEGESRENADAAKLNPKETEWSGEIFGIEIRIQEGKLVFFQEKKAREED